MATVTHTTDFLALCRGGSFDNDLQYYIELPKKLAAILSQTVKIPSASAVLRAKQRDFTREFDSLCREVLDIIDDVVTLCRLCNNDRRERVKIEIDIRKLEGRGVARNLAMGGKNFRQETTPTN